MQLTELAAAWRSYEVTPDNEYSDGRKDGLDEAAYDLEAALARHEAEQYYGRGLPEELKDLVSRLVAYNYDDEERDYEENGGDGHIFTVILRLAEITGFKPAGRT